MILSTTKRFIFVASTKTASTSIESVLAPYADLVVTKGGPGGKHMRASEIADFHPEYFKELHWEDFYSFGVMRDPLDWISSWFRYRLGNKVENKLPPDMSFEKFWEEKDWNIRRNDGSKYLQRDLFFSTAGDLMTSKILRYENLSEDMAEVAKRIDVADLLSLDHLNVSKIKKKRVIPDHLIDEVTTYYEEDFELYYSLF